MGAAGVGGVEVGEVPVATGGVPATSGSAPELSVAGPVQLLLLKRLKATVPVGVTPSAPVTVAVSVAVSATPTVPVLGLAVGLVVGLFGAVTTFFLASAPPV